MLSLSTTCAASPSPPAAHVPARAAKCCMKQASFDWPAAVAQVAAPAPGRLATSKTGTSQNTHCFARAGTGSGPPFKPSSCWAYVYSYLTPRAMGTAWPLALPSHADVMIGPCTELYALRTFCSAHAHGPHARTQCCPSCPPACCCGGPSIVLCKPPLADAGWPTASCRLPPALRATAVRRLRHLYNTTAALTCLWCALVP